MPHACTRGFNTWRNLFACAQGTENQAYNVQEFVCKWSFLWQKVISLPNWERDIKNRVILDIMNGDCDGPYQAGGSLSAMPADSSTPPLSSLLSFGCHIAEPDSMGITWTGGNGKPAAMDLYISMMDRIWSSSPWGVLFMVEGEHRLCC